MRFVAIAVLLATACAGSRPGAPVSPRVAPGSMEPAADLVSAVSAAGLERPNATGLLHLDGKKAAEAFKNATLLGDLPADRLYLAMESMRHSLGVECGHCHDPAGGFAADTKAPKQTARLMMTMSLDVNRRFFHEKTRVTCFTCHRGDAVPDVPPPAEGGFWPLPPLSEADAAKPAREVYKDLKVLGDGPAGRLPQIMKAFSSALGVRCDGCHVPNKWAEETERKARAREMLAMVRSIGETHFAGKKNPVRCATCHHGEHEPSRFAGPRLTVKLAGSAGAKPPRVGMLVLGPPGFSVKDSAALMQLFMTGKAADLSPMMVFEQAEADYGHLAPGAYSLCSVKLPDDADPEKGNFGPPAPLDCQPLHLADKPAVQSVERTVQ